MAKVMLSIPDELLKILDDAARDASKNRSELIRDAVRLYIASGRPTLDRATIIKQIRERKKGIRLAAAPEEIVRQDRESHR
jgi:metal-responsive CopG/Arc/MetJ family transcriptional regulator